MVDVVVVVVVVDGGGGGGGAINDHDDDSDELYVRFRKYWYAFESWIEPWLKDFECWASGDFSFIIILSCGRTDLGVERV